MLESVALARLTWHRIRFASALVFAIMATGVTIATALRLVYPQAAIFFLLVGFLPVAIWSMLVFDTDFQHSVEGIETGFDPWLLRMPIATWKLAVIPASLRAMTVGGTWVFYAVMLSYLLDTPIPKLMPAIAFATASVWLAGAAWRPFSRVLTRTITGLTLFASVIGWASFVIWADLELAGGLGRFGLTSLAVAFLLAGFRFAERCLAMARHQPDGRLSASPLSFDWNYRGNGWLHRPIADQAVFIEPRKALAWHDRVNIPVNVKIALGCFTIVLFLFVLWVPLKAGVMLTMLLVLVFSFSQFGLALCAPRKDGRILPPYLVASPIRDQEFAWWRAVAIVRMFRSTIVGLLLISLIWLVRAIRQGVYQDWSAAMASRYETDWAALKIITAIAILVGVGTLGRSLTGLWSAMMGRPRVHLYAMILSMFWIFAPMLVLPVWMLNQRDYDSAIANAWWWAGWLPLIGLSWLLVKSLGVLVASVIVVRSGLVTPAELLRLVIGWIAIVGTSFGLLVGLNPEPFIRPAWIALLLVFLLPLSRVVILPYSVHLDRHR